MQELVVEIGLRIAKVLVASLVRPRHLLGPDRPARRPRLRAARARVLDRRGARLPDPGDGHLLGRCVRPRRRRRALARSGSGRPGRDFRTASAGAFGQAFDGRRPAGPILRVLRRARPACFGAGCTLTTEEWQRARKHGCASGQTLGRSRSRKAVHSFGEFDPGSGSTLAACMRHASRTDDSGLLESLVADG